MEDLKCGGRRGAQASLAKEVQGSKTAVHILSPGMVATDLLLRDRGGTPAARIINILAEDAATVAAWLVPRMRAVRGNGAAIRCVCHPPPLRVSEMGGKHLEDGGLRVGLPESVCGWCSLSLLGGVPYPYPSNYVSNYISNYLWVKVIEEVFVCLKGAVPSPSQASS